MKPVALALFVFLFMALLVAHAYNGFLHSVMPPGSATAIRAFDELINDGMVANLGRMPTVGLLSLLTVVFSALAYRRAAAEEAAKASATTPAISLASTRAVPMPGMPPGVMETWTPRPPKPPPPLPDGFPSPAIAAEHTLVFTHVYPPRLPMKSLTFFGGLPIAPRNFQWPAAVSTLGAPEALPFMGQIDCGSLPPGPNRGLLPDSGVLYFFANFSPTIAGNVSPLAVKYVAAAPTPEWSEIRVPPDTPPTYGVTDAPYRWPWLYGRPESDYPRSFPKVEMQTAWIPTFDSLYRHAQDAEDDEIMAEWRAKRDAVLVELHGQPRADDPMFSIFGKSNTSLWRPIEGFPLAWMSIDMVAGHLRSFLDEQRRWLDRNANRPADANTLDAAAWDERLAAYESIEAEAQRWSRRAAENGAMSEPSADVKAEFWEWLEAMRADGNLAAVDRHRSSINFEITQWLSQAAILTSEAMLVDETAAPRVPAEAVEALRNRHTVLREHIFRDGGVYQHHMFGRGRLIQVMAEDMFPTHYLLMQLDPDDGLDWSMGDAGAFQYWITPQDLAARRFENVVMTFECH